MKTLLRVMSYLFNAVAFLSLAVLGHAAPAKIGVLLKDKSSPYWDLVSKGAIEAGRTLGAEVIVREPPTVQNMGAQILLLNGFAKDGIDALVIAPINLEALQKPVADLAAKGVKIVAIDAHFDGGIDGAFIGNDNNAMSEAAAQFFCSLIHDGDEVAVLRFNNVDRAVIEREKRIIEVLRRSGPKIVLHADIYGNSEKDAEARQVAYLLETYPKTKAIITSALSTTTAAIQVLQDKGLSGNIKLVGFGAYLPAEVRTAIERGVLHGWIAQQPKSIGSKAVNAAAALVAGRSVSAEDFADYTLVTKANLQDPKTQALANP